MDSATEITRLEATIEDQSRGVDELHDQLDELILASRKLSEENQSFGNVLAIVHGDGGHYITEHGHRKASKDAIKIINTMRMELEDKPKFVEPTEPALLEYYGRLETKIDRIIRLLAG